MLQRGFEAGRERTDRGCNQPRRKQGPSDENAAVRFRCADVRVQSRGAQSRIEIGGAAHTQPARPDTQVPKQVETRPRTGTMPARGELTKARVGRLRLPHLSTIVAPKKAAEKSQRRGRLCHRYWGRFRLTCSISLASRTLMP